MINKFLKYKCSAINNCTNFLFCLALITVLVACKKEPYKGTSKLKLTEIKDFSDWDKNPETIKKTVSSDYLLHLETFSSYENEIVLLNENFEKQKSYTNFHHIKDYIMLPDGRLLISQYYFGDNENIVLIENDFSTRAQFSLNLEYPPMLHLAQDGIIMISANAYFGTSVIAKYDFNFTKLWSKSLSQIRPFFSHYDSQANYVYVMNNDFVLYEIDVASGIVSNSFALTTEAWNLTRDGDNLYVFGIENDGTTCGDDLEIVKLDLSGNEIWNVQLGRKESKDIVADIFVDNGLVYISGSYGESNCMENYFNYSDFYTAVITEDGELIGNRIENEKKDVISGRGSSILKSDDGQVYILGITDFVQFSDRKIAIYKYKL